MKYLKFTYVDAVTGVSIAQAPAQNGPRFPAVTGLAFEWARESAYPTDVPQFFGVCPDDSAIDVPGVIHEFGQYDYDNMRADEFAARPTAQHPPAR